MPNSAAYMRARTARPAWTHRDGTVRATLPIATNNVCSHATCDGRSTDTARESSGDREPHRNGQGDLHDAH